MCWLDSSSVSSVQPSQGPGDLLSEHRSMNEHLWGYLKPYNPAASQIDFCRSCPQYKFGRDTENNDIVFLDSIISNQHCVIVWDDNHPLVESVAITDLSSNGTFVNGRRIGRKKTCVIITGDVIAFASANPQEIGLEDYRFTFYRAETNSLLEEQYCVGEVLGKGGFATVRKAVQRDTQVVRAVKMIAAPRKKDTREEARRTPHEHFIREISIMKLLDHRNICKLVDTFFEYDGALSLVLELVEGGDLLRYVLRTSNGLDEPSSKDITHQICSAMAYVHSLGISHRDLKLENILLTNEVPPTVKIADFGLAKMMDGLQSFHTMCGTVSYIAPEVTTDPQGYNHMVDSWSVGVIVFSMLTRQSPFPEMEGCHIMDIQHDSRDISWCLLEDTDFPLTTDAKIFMNRLLQDSPGSRMSLTESLSHDWITRSRRGESTAEEEHSAPRSAENLSTEHRLHRVNLKAKGKALNSCGLRTLPEDVELSFGDSKPTAGRLSQAEEQKQAVKLKAAHGREKRSKTRSRNKKAELGPYSGPMTRSRKRQLSAAQHHPPLNEDPSRRPIQQWKEGQASKTTGQESESVHS